MTFAALLLAGLVAVPFPGAQRVDLVRYMLIGKWEIVAEKTQDGKMTPLDSPAGPIVISDRTLTLYAGDTIIWQANYRVDTSKSPFVMYGEVTRGPCMSGNKDMKENFSFEKGSSRLGGMVLKRQSK